MSCPAYKFDHVNRMVKEKGSTMTNKQSNTHNPVLLKECIESLKIKPNGDTREPRWQWDIVGDG